MLGTLILPCQGLRRNVPLAILVKKRREERSRVEKILAKMAVLTLPYPGV